MAKTSESVLRAVAKYAKTHTKAICLRFNLKTDADILARLDSVGNKQGYIKELIRRDMQRTNR